ncbi:hypothetical protein Tco_1229721 [Tanacetum coccineum]
MLLLTSGAGWREEMRRRREIRYMRIGGGWREISSLIDFSFDASTYDVPEIFMQQFWYTIKKVQDTDSYEFLLANKKCTVNAALTFLIDLGYKGPLNRHTNMFMDHMNQLWRTLAAIINKCLFGKIARRKAKKKGRVARKVHATHARIVTESVPESAKKKSSGRSSKSVVIQDTPSAPKSKPATSKAKLKAETISTGGSNEDKDITKEKVILEWGNKQDSEFFDDDNDNVEKDDKDGNVDDEGDDHVSDTQYVDDEDVKIEYDEDDIYKYKIPKEEAEKTSEAKDDAKKTELPPSSLSLSVSLGFGDQFLKLSSDPSLVSTVKDSADADVMILETTNLPPIPEIVTKTLVLTDTLSPQVTPIFSYVQQTPTPPITTDALTVTTIVPESNALSAVELRVAKLEKDVPKLKTVDHSSEALVVL